jgi:hypothetical protein
MQNNLLVWVIVNGLISLTTSNMGWQNFASSCVRWILPKVYCMQCKIVLPTLNERYAAQKGTRKNAFKLKLKNFENRSKPSKEIVDNPKAAEEQTQKNIEAGLERERRPERDKEQKTSTKFINPPPGVAPNYFQDRIVETNRSSNFLNDDARNA